MSKEAAAQWIKQLHEDEGLRKQAEAVDSFEDRQSLADEHGFEFTKEEIDDVVSACKGQLSDDELDAVSGGGGGEDAFMLMAASGIGMGSGGVVGVAILAAV